MIQSEELSFVHVQLSEYLIDPLISLILKYWIPFCIHQPRMKIIKQLDWVSTDLCSIVPSGEGFFYLEEDENNNVFICSTDTSQKRKIKWKSPQILLGLLPQIKEECDLNNRTVAFLTSSDKELAIHIINDQGKELIMRTRSNWDNARYYKNHPNRQCITQITQRFYMKRRAFQYNFDLEQIRSIPYDFKYKVSISNCISVIPEKILNRKRKRKRRTKTIFHFSIQTSDDNNDSPLHFRMFYIPLRKRISILEGGQGTLALLEHNNSDWECYQYRQSLNALILT